MSRFNINRIYATNPTPILHMNVKRLVAWDKSIKRYRFKPTGRLVSKEKAMQIAGQNAYFNSVRAIARAGEFRTLAEAEELMTAFDQVWKGLDEEELDSARRDVFGSP